MNVANPNREAGFSVVYVLIAFGLLAGVAFVATRYFSFRAENLERMVDKGRTHDLTQYAKSFIDCERTIAANYDTCELPEGGYISGINSNDEVVIPRYPHAELLTHNTALRLHCEADGNIYRLNADYAILKSFKRKVVVQTSQSSSTAEPTALDDKYVDVGWKDANNGIPLVCKREQAPAPCAPLPIAASTIPGAVTFEDIPGARDGLNVDDTVNSYLADNYNFTVSYDGGATMKLAKIVRQGESNPNFKAWASARCPGRPGNNRLCFSGGSAGGRWALSSSNAKSSNRIKFTVTYLTPAKNPSFDLYDFDGNETWVVKAYDINGVEIDRKRYDAGRGYNRNRTGNSGVLNVSFDTGEANIASLKLSGSKNIRIFGFAFDNFHTGIPYCRSNR